MEIENWKKFNISQFWILNEKLKYAKMHFYISILNWKLNGTFGALILMPSFVFHFHKKWKTKYDLFFVFMKKLKNELLEQIKINFMIIITSIVCTLFKSQFVSSPPEVFRCAMVTRTPRIRCLKNSWCILMFTLLAATFMLGSFS